MKELCGLNFKTMRPEIVYLAALRFEGLRVSGMPLSPRLAAFVEAAREKKMLVAKRLCWLAC